MAEFTSKVRYMGFCGADDSINPNLLSVLSLHYPWIEWGVLFRSDLQGTARYASPEWVQQLANLKKNSPKMNLAAHLCFDRCQQILYGDSTFVKELFLYGFRRVQVNITKANGIVVDYNKLPEYASNIRSVMNEMKEIEWIFQLNEETQPIWDILLLDLPSNVSILYDASCGKGIAITEFPATNKYGSVPCGYAGGIGPNNVSSVLVAVSSIVDPEKVTKPVWIDMESSLRTIVLIQTEGNEVRKDVFDINKCMNCIEDGIKAGFPKY